VHPAFGSNFITSGREAKFSISLSFKLKEMSRLVAQRGRKSRRDKQEEERGEREVTLANISAEFRQPCFPVRQ